MRINDPHELSQVSFGCAGQFLDLAGNLQRDLGFGNIRIDEVPATVARAVVGGVTLRGKISAAKVYAHHCRQILSNTDDEDRPFVNARTTAMASPMIKRPRAKFAGSTHMVQIDNGNAGF